MRTYQSLLFFLIPLLAVANHHDTRSLQHRRHIPRSDAPHLESRGFRATFYDVGLGACGKVNFPGEFVIALNVPQFAGGAHCFDHVTISHSGKTTQATVVDECMGCPYGAIDMSRGLFNFFADEAQGEIAVDWGFGGGPPKPPAPKAKPPPPPPPPPKKTHTTPSSTWSEPQTSTTYSAPSSTSANMTSSTMASNSTSAALPTSTPSPVPSAAPSQYHGPHNLEDLGTLISELGKLVAAAGQ